MPLSDIVNVQITRQTTSVSEQGFGIPLILGTTKSFNNLSKKYTNLQQVSVDFPSYTPEYIAADEVFSQGVTPPYLYIGRRTVDTVDITVETPLPNSTYNVFINGQVVSVNSNDVAQSSVITLSAALVTSNLINVSFNGTIVGTVTSKITYSTPFVSGTSTITTVNGVAAGAAVPFTTSNAGTLTAIAAQLSALTGVVASATSDGTSTITVVFTNPGNNTVDNSVTTGGSAPTATISEGGFTFATSNAATMGVIAAALDALPTVTSAVVSGGSSNIITVITDTSNPAVIDFFTVKLGASQATATIKNYNLADSIATALAAAISGAALGVTSAVISPPSPNFSITASVAGTPYTVSVSSVFSQNPLNARIFITQAGANQAYNVKINGTTFSYTSPNAGNTNEEVSLALVTIINGSTYTNQQGVVVPNPIFGIVTATDNGNGTFELATAVSTGFLVQVFPLEVMQIQTGLIIGPYVPSASVVTDLEAIYGVNTDWYGLACTDRTSATVQAIAGWVETQKLIFGTASSDPNIINQAPGDDTTSIAYLLQNAGYVRSFVIYHQDANSAYPECAWFGKVLPLVPGSETWKFKTLNTIDYSILTPDQQNNAFGKNCNTYEYIGGVGITQNGTMAVGEFIDIIRGVDWLTSTIQTFVYATLINNPKVPYTDAGITAIEAQIRRALDLGISNNFLSDNPPYIVEVPLAANVPPNDKANRVLNGVSFQATLAGAIQAVNITGTVSV